MESSAAFSRGAGGGGGGEGEGNGREGKSKVKVGWGRGWLGRRRIGPHVYSVVPGVSEG